MKMKQSESVCITVFLPVLSKESSLFFKASNLFQIQNNKLVLGGGKTGCNGDKTKQ